MSAATRGAPEQPQSSSSHRGLDGRWGCDELNRSACRHFRMPVGRDSTMGWRFSRTCCRRCARRAPACRTSGVGGTSATRWRTSGWRLSRFSACRADRSWPISGLSRSDTAGRIARPCSACRRSRRTITSGRCWTARIRAILTGASSRSSRGAEAQGGLQAFRRLGGHVLIALDGTESFTFRKLHCPQCSQRRRSDGGLEYFHGLPRCRLGGAARGLRPGALEERERELQRPQKPRLQPTGSALPHRPRAHPTPS
jgi:hypothetical protein